MKAKESDIVTRQGGHAVSFSINADFLAEQNRVLEPALTEDYEALARQLARRNVAIEPLVRQVMAFGVALPTWGVGTGGTRFARFPGPGEPRHLIDKIDDCATIHQLVRATPTLSPHFPWDETSDYAALRETAATRGLCFDAVNSNTFQDQPGQTLSYKFGSLSHVDAAVRAQAIAHNVDCIAIGRATRLEGADRVDRRRLEFRRPVEPDRARSTAISPRCAKSTRRCRATGGCSSSTSSTSRPSIRR